MENKNGDSDCPISEFLGLVPADLEESNGEITAMWSNPQRSVSDSPTDSGNPDTGVRRIKDHSHSLRREWVRSTDHPIRVVKRICVRTGCDYFRVDAEKDEQTTLGEIE